MNVVGKASLAVDDDDEPMRAPSPLLPEPVRAVDEDMMFSLCKWSPDINVKLLPTLLCLCFDAGYELIQNFVYY